MGFENSNIIFQINVLNIDFRWVFARILSYFCFIGIFLVDLIWLMTPFGCLHTIIDKEFQFSTKRLWPRISCERGEIEIQKRFIQFFFIVVITQSILDLNIRKIWQFSRVFRKICSFTHIVSSGLYLCIKSVLILVPEWRVTH